MTHVALLLRLAALTGQRPGDVRRMSEEDLLRGLDGLVPPTESADDED